MANRFRKFFESIVYAGMKPSGARTAPQEASSARPALLARLFSEPAPDDPFYLTNQTPAQKARRMLLIAGPLVVVLVLVVVAFAVFRPKVSKSAKEPPPAEVDAKMLPAFNKEIHLPNDKDLEVVEVHFEHNGQNLMVGNLRNLTDHELAEATVVFDLADADRSQLGAVTVTETNLAPSTVRAFKLPIDEANATFAVVREVHTR